jgi:Flp pilus assembly protein TadD
MYKDPEEREQQIKNISSAFRELADGILPQLRRARLTINYETVGRSDDQILAQIKDDASKLSIEEMLYGAALKDNLNEKEDIYKLATEVYPNDARAYNNLATIQYARGNYDAAKQYIQKAQRLSTNLPEAQANLGMLALQAGDLSAAEQYIAAATGANGLNEVLGNLHLAQGNFAQAEQDFSDIYSNSAALAQILNKNYASAAVTLKYVKNPDATTEYLKALLYNRMGNKEDSKEALNKAVKDAFYAKYAANDLELKK